MPFLKKREWKVCVEESALEPDGNIKRMRLSISDKEGNHLGDLHLTEVTVAWYKDIATIKTEEPFKNREFEWDRFINMIETHKFAGKTETGTKKRKG